MIFKFTMMFRSAAFLILCCLAIATRALAQEAPLQLMLIPGGATHFTEGTDTGEPSFTNYDAGAALTVNLNRYFGVEGELVGSIGISQQLDFSGVRHEFTTPNLLQYNGNVVVSAPNMAVVPFVTGGVGSVIVFDREALGIQRNRAFLSGNVGGGVKWNAGRWGLRADYRFLAVRSRDVTPSGHGERPRPDFFGKENRFGHRLYAGVMVNFFLTGSDVMLGVCLFVWCLGQSVAPAERVALMHDFKDRFRTERVLGYEFRWLVAGAVDQPAISNAVFGGVLPLRIQMLRGRVAVTGGAILASTTVPRDGTHANFMAKLDVRLTDRVGFTYWHWSNANLGHSNPSVDSVGVTVRLRRLGS